MKPPRWITLDGNEAAAYVAHLTNEVIAIYPITPASPMGELADAWSAAGKKNIFGTVPEVIEMQSEGGAAGAVHGALQAGALTTTFTASQGLLLMIPNMFKIAGELTSTVFHIAARSVATHALSIFGDHSDVMATRSTGWAMLFAASVQEAQDFALIAQAATLEARVPFLHFFDGFRTSHEVNKIEQLTPDDVRAMIDDDHVQAHRNRALSPDRPVLRGSAQNPDVFFQAREAVNMFYEAVPGIVQQTMDRFAGQIGRQLPSLRLCRCARRRAGGRDPRLGCRRGGGSGPNAGRTRREGGVDQGSTVPSVLRRSICRGTPAHDPDHRGPGPHQGAGSLGEPLYLDVVTALVESWSSRAKGAAPIPRVIGGRYGLSSKEFTPAMAAAVFDELAGRIPSRTSRSGSTTM